MNDAERVTRRSRMRWWLLVAVVPVALGLSLYALASAAYGERPPAAEAASLQQLLELRAGAVVGEIGAGDGRIAVELGRLLGPGGLVYATELDSGLVRTIGERARSAGVSNVRAVAAAEHATNLPEGSCDAVFMRRVYHDLTDPASVLADIHRSLKPGGRLAIVDFEPTFLGNLLMPRRTNRPGHGIERAVLLREAGAAGYSVQTAPRTWPDDNMFVAVFAAPE